jgi:hypothetical protein
MKETLLLKLFDSFRIARHPGSDARERPPGFSPDDLSNPHNCRE